MPTLTPERIKKQPYNINAVIEQLLMFGGLDRKTVKEEVPRNLAMLYLVGDMANIPRCQVRECYRERLMDFYGINLANYEGQQ